MELLGSEVLGEYGLPGRRYFRVKTARKEAERITFMRSRPARLKSSVTWRSATT